MKKKIVGNKRECNGQKITQFLVMQQEKEILCPHVCLKLDIYSTCRCAHLMHVQHMLDHAFSE